jgi:protease IV
MKQFFKMLFASMFGFIIGTFVLFFILLFVLSMMVSSMNRETVTITDNSILHLKLDQEIKERSSKNPFEDFNFSDFSSNHQLGLNDILKNIEKASKDEKIKGIYLDIQSYNGGLATVEEIRNALLAFKKSGKFIYAYCDYYTQGAYYLASTSDKIFLNPEGQVSLTGIASQSMFFKGTLEKLEIEPQVIRHGKFKSAIEPFILDKMSPENRQQVAAFVDPIWNHISQQICLSRKIENSTFKNMVDSMLLSTAADAKRYKVVDELKYYDEFSMLLAKKLNKKDAKELPLISLNKYSKSPDKSGIKLGLAKIAVIYAVGDIGNGEGDDESIGSDRLSATIRKARLDDKIKAIVLRVNSPGGDALASEEIWREVSLAKKSKPVIVSMGDLAASGGYYISCAANTIVAQPNTLTGSIGVFGLLLNAEKMFKNKLGITTDIYKTNPYTDMGSITRPLTSSETQILQREVDRIYDVFTRRVADGRGLTQEQVDSIGQGRVWSGINALQNGLADTLGGIETAIAIAAKQAKLTEYRIIQLPEQKDPVQELVEDFSSEMKTKYMKEDLGESYTFVKAAKDLLKLRGVQALSMYRIGFY